MRILELKHIIHVFILRTTPKLDLAVWVYQLTTVDTLDHITVLVFFLLRFNYLNWLFFDRFPLLRGPSRVGRHKKIIRGFQVFNLVGDYARFEVTSCEAILVKFAIATTPVGQHDVFVAPCATYSEEHKHVKAKNTQV